MLLASGAVVALVALVPAPPRSRTLPDPKVIAMYRRAAELLARYPKPRVGLALCRAAWEVGVCADEPDRCLARGAHPCPWRATEQLEPFTYWLWREHAGV